MTSPLSLILLRNALANESQAGVVRLATVDEVIAGTENDLAVSPLNMQLAFDSGNYVVDGNSGAGEDYHDDTSAFTVTPASNTPATELEAGIVRLATDVETIAGTDGTIAITPFSLKAALDDSSYVWDGGEYAT